MNLNQAQKAIYFRIVEEPKVLRHFDVLCAEFEAALDEVEDPEKTDPFGVVAVLSEADRPGVQITEAATVITVAWLEMIATAITEQEGELDSGLFDRDGVSAFCDTRPLFEVAKACGFGEGHARRAFARVRKDAPTVPRRALKILGTIRAIKVVKRKETLRQVSRIKPLETCFARHLGRDEIARAKAGSIIYTLVARKDGYEAVRVRRMKVRQTTDATGAPVDVISEANVDVMDGFNVPLVPCEELHGTALVHFIQFLDEESERKSRHTYQRLVHRAVAA